MNTILFTGGGTAGHVTPNIAIIAMLKEKGFNIHYIGSKKGIEKDIIEKEQIVFHGIHTGKFRRYFDVQNITDMLRIILGFFESIVLIALIKPDLLFSKGGFVSPPVVWASWLLRVPIIIHESDISPGLANRISIPFATTILYSFPETKALLSKKKALFSGLPVRQMFEKGNRRNGLRICKFSDHLPVILVIGGSQGAETINRTVRKSLQILLDRFQVCHICGKGNIDENTKEVGYAQFEYVNEELPDLFAASDAIVSRAGATTVFEILYSKKPSLLIPLGSNASRGDQVENARTLNGQGLCSVLYQEDLNADSLVSRINSCYDNREHYINAITWAEIPDGKASAVKTIMSLLPARHENG